MKGRTLQTCTRNPSAILATAVIWGYLGLKPIG